LPQKLGTARVRDLAADNRSLHPVFQPWHNAHWSVPAAEKGTAFVPLGAVDLEGILCVQQERVAAADNTGVLGNGRLPIEPSALRCSFAKYAVKVCEHLDGTLSVRYGPHVLGRWDAGDKVLAMRKVAWVGPPPAALSPQGGGRAEQQQTEKSGQITYYKKPPF
jgi:hypothetical protein